MGKARKSFIINILQKIPASRVDRCADFKIEWDQTKRNNDIECVKKDGQSIEVTVPSTGGCFYGFATCYDSKGCVLCVVPIKACPCTNNGMCGDCESCDNNECVSSCNKGETCNNNTCSDCGPDNPCPKGTKCKPIKEDGIIRYVCICPNGYVLQEGETECPSDTPPDCGDQIWNGDKCCDCEKTGDCEDPNAECDGCDCVCKKGYHKDPETNKCVENPKCTTDSDCEGDCDYCDENNKCAKDESLTWTQGDPIPDGYGVLGDCLVECVTLDCNKCGLAVGCECEDGDTCLSDDCDEEALSLVLLKEPGVPGQTSQSKKSLLGFGTVTSLDLVSIGTANNQSGSGIVAHSFIRDQEFYLEVNDLDSCLTEGTWYYSPMKGVERIIPSAPITDPSLSSVTFKLSDSVINYNQFGFYVFFRDTNGREVRFRALFNQDTSVENGQSLQVDGNWNVVYDKSNSVQGDLVGGTPDICKICSTNSNFVFAKFLGLNQLSITPNSGNTLDVIFSIDPSDPTCLIYQTQGCGVWDGTVELTCKGRRVSIDIPTIEIDESLCCEGADCFGEGGGCEDDEDSIDISDYILAFPLFGMSNEYSLQIQVSENGPVNGSTSPVSFEDLWLLGDNVSDCWTQDSNQVSLGLFDGLDEGSLIYSEVSLNPILQGGTTLTTICFGSECFSGSGVGITECRKIQGCTQIDICDTAHMLVYDRNTGLIINNNTYQTQVNQDIDFIAIYSFPNTPNLNYNIIGLSGVTVNSNHQSLAGGVVLTGTMQVDSGTSGQLNFEVNGFCNVGVPINFNYQCPEIILNVVSSAGNCGEGVVAYQINKLIGGVSVPVTESYELWIGSDLVSTSDSNGSGTLNLESGTYSVQLGGSCGGSGVIDADFGDNFDVSLSQGGSVCENSNFEFLVTGPENGSFTYNAGAGSITESFNSNGEFLLQILNITQPLTVNITSATDGTCTKNLNISESITIENAPEVGPIQVVGQDNLCFGDDLVLFVAGQGIVSLNIVSYSGSGSPVIAPFNAGSNHQVPGLPVGDYVVEILSIDSALECEPSVLTGQASFTISQPISYTENLDCVLENGIISVNDEYTVQGLGTISQTNIPSGLTLTQTGSIVTVIGTVASSILSYSFNIESGNECDDILVERELNCDCAQVPDPVLSSNSLNYCVGDPIGSIVVNNSSSQDLFVSGPSGLVNLGNQNTITFSPSSLGNYIFYVGEAPCQSGQVSLSVFPFPEINVLPQEEYEICDDQDVVLNFAISGGTAPYTFLWTGPNGQVLNMQNPLISGSDSSNNGNWLVEVTDNNGCEAEGNISVSIENCCELEVSVDTTNCFSTELTAQVTGGSGNYTYQWIKNGDTNDPFTTQTITGLTVGETCSFVLIVMDDEGCVGEISFEFTPEECQPCNFIFFVDNSGSISSAEFEDMEQNIVDISTAINSVAPSSTYSVVHYWTGNGSGSSNVSIEHNASNGPISSITKQAPSLQWDYLQPNMTELLSMINNGDFNFADPSLPCKIIILTDAFGEGSSLIADAPLSTPPWSFNDGGNGGTDQANQDHSLIVIKYEDPTFDHPSVIQAFEQVAGVGNVYQTQFGEDPTDDILDNLNCNCE